LGYLNIKTSILPITLFRIAGGTPVKKHLNGFNSINVDLKSLDVQVEDEDKAILSVVSLPLSYKHSYDLGPLLPLTGLLA